jgi:hypothetical protein
MQNNNNNKSQTEAVVYRYLCLHRQVDTGMPTIITAIATSLVLLVLQLEEMEMEMSTNTLGCMFQELERLLAYVIPRLHRLAILTVILTVKARMAGKRIAPVQHNRPLYQV